MQPKVTSAGISFKPSPEDEEILIQRSKVINRIKKNINKNINDFYIKKNENPSDSVEKYMRRRAMEIYIKTIKDYFIFLNSHNHALDDRYFNILDDMEEILKKIPKIRFKGGVKKELKGGGLVDVVKKVTDKAKNILSIAESYNNISKKTIRLYGHLPIVRLQIVRKPIPRPISYLVNLVSNGVSKEKFDELYHLSLVAFVQDKKNIEKQIIIEKLEVVNITTGFRVDPQAEVLNVNISQMHGLGNVHDMLEKTRKHMGNYKFFSYSATLNNCQYFIRALLNTAGLYHEPERKFLFQNLKDIIENTPYWAQKIAGLATHSASLFSKFMGKGRMKRIKGGAKEKIYCGTKEPPKGYKKGTMKECAELGKINEYGKNKADKKSVKISESKNRELKSVLDKIQTLINNYEGNVKGEIKKSVKKEIKEEEDEEEDEEEEKSKKDKLVVEWAGLKGKKSKLNREILDNNLKINNEKTKKKDKKILEKENKEKRNLLNNIEKEIEKKYIQIKEQKK